MSLYFGQYDEFKWDVHWIAHFACNNDSSKLGFFLLHLMHVTFFNKLTLPSGPQFLQDEPYSHPWFPWLPNTPLMNLHMDRPRGRIKVLLQPSLAVELSEFNFCEIINCRTITTQSTFYLNLKLKLG